LISVGWACAPSATVGRGHRARRRQPRIRTTPKGPGTYATAYGSFDRKPLIEVVSSKPQSAAKVVQPVARATVKPPSFATNRTSTVCGTLPFVLTCRVPFTKPLRLAAEALGARPVGMISRNALLVEVARETRARLSTDAHFETITEYLPSGKFLVALCSPAVSGLAVCHVLQIVTGR